MPKRTEPKEELVDLGRRLRAARDRSGMTLLQAGVAIGVDPQTVSRIELGKQAVSSQTVKKLAVLYRVSADFLLDTGTAVLAEPMYPSLADFLEKFRISDDGERGFLLAQRFGMDGDPDENTWMSLLSTYRASRRGKAAGGGAELARADPGMMPARPAPKAKRRGE